MTTTASDQRIFRLTQKIVGAFTAVLILWVIIPARASTYQGYVQGVEQQPGSSEVFIEVGNGSWGVNSCGASSLWVLITSGTATSSDTLALALDAMALGAEVYVAGNGVCTQNAPNDNYSEGLAAFWLE